MKFFEIINKKKITLISVFLFLYVFLNLLDGERGLISYYEKQKVISNLNKKKELLNQLDDLLLETFQTSSVLIDEQRLVNGEEGCLCNIDLEYIENNSKQGLFDLDLLDDKSQEKIEARINQIFGALDA